MTKKIFQSIMLTAGAVLLASLVIILGCLYDYFQGVQQDQLRDELSLAAQAVELGGSDYLESLDSQNYRLTWIDADGRVLCDTRTDAETMEIAEMVLNKVNKSLVKLVQELGVLSVGISGKDGGLLTVEKKYLRNYLKIGE